MPDQPRRSAFVWLVLLACGVYAGFFAFTTYAVVRYYGVEKAPGWNLRTDGTGWFVTSVDAGGPADGRIQLGDRLVAINGDQRRAVFGPYAWSFERGGKTYRVDLDRRGERVSLELPMPLVPGQQFAPIPALVGLAFFICGAALALLRPHDAQVRLAAIFLISVGFAGLGQSFRVFGFLVGWERKVHFAMAPTFLWALPLAYQFFSRFPVWRSPGPVWRTIQWLLYASFALVIWPASAIMYLGLGVSDGATRFLVAHPSLYLTSRQVMQLPRYAYLVVCLVLSLAVAARNYQRLRDPDSRRRIQWVIAGAMIAAIPLVTLHFVFSVAEWGNDRTYYLLSPLSFLTMLCIPVSIGAAVWKEQLFDIRVLVRRGLQYLFARTALRALLVLPIALLLFSIFKNPNRTIAQILTQGSGWLNIVLMGVIGAALQSRQRLQTALDRRFFREAYHQEQVLVHLIDEVRQLDSLAEIARLVSTRVESVLHPASQHIFYRAEERSECFEGHSSSDSFVGQQLSRQKTLLRAIDTAKAIRDFPSDFKKALPDDEHRWLESLGVRLIVPITETGERLVGLLLLGERRSEEPYSATDRRLLQGIASQIGLVYENQHLKERVRLDADVRRDVLARLEERNVSLLKECPVCGRCYDGATERCGADGAEVTLTLPIERLDGYRHERALAAAASGAVFEAAACACTGRWPKVMMDRGDQAALRR